MAAQFFAAVAGVDVEIVDIELKPAPEAGAQPKTAAADQLFAFKNPNRPVEGLRSGYNVTSLSDIQS